MTLKGLLLPLNCFFWALTSPVFFSLFVALGLQFEVLAADADKAAPTSGAPIVKQQMTDIKSSIALPVDKKPTNAESLKLNAASTNVRKDVDLTSAKPVNPSTPIPPDSKVEPSITSLELRVRALLEGKLGTDGELILRADGDLTGVSTSKPSGAFAGQGGSISSIESADQGKRSKAIQGVVIQSTVGEPRARTAGAADPAVSSMKSNHPRQAVSSREDRKSDKTSLLNGGARWTWSGPSGPQNWGRIDPDFAQCSSGKFQSPIVIRSSDVLDSSMLLPEFQWEPASFRAEKDRGVLKFNLLTNSRLKFRGLEWRLHHLEFRVPGEHFLDDQGYDASVILHYQSNQRLLNLSVPIVGKNDSAANASFRVLMQRMPLGEDDLVSTNDRFVNLADFIPNPSGSAFLYHGSLTLPPCTEGVLHVVLRNPLVISLGQFLELKSFAPLGVRPPQNIEKRPVMKLS